MCNKKGLVVLFCLAESSCRIKQDEALGARALACGDMLGKVGAGLTVVGGIKPRVAMNVATNGLDIFDRVIHLFRLEEIDHRRYHIDVFLFEPYTDRLFFHIVGCRKLGEHRR